MCSSGGSNVVNGRGTPTVPSVIVVHRNRDVNAPNVHCPKAGRHVEKQHQMMNRAPVRVMCVYRLGPRQSTHHHEAGNVEKERNLMIHTRRGGGCADELTKGWTYAAIGAFRCL